MANLLPELPPVTVEVVRDRTGDPTARPFLDVRRLDLVTVERSEGVEGKKSATFTYDVLTRRALDACVMVAHHVEGGVVQVWLRSALRPPPALRPIAPAHDGRLWELPAGLVEPGEAPRAAAARELAEELGFAVAESDLGELGPASFPAPGFIGELHHYFHVRVDPATRGAPAGDGSALEEGAAIVAVPLARALDACARGEVRDAKTELALRRLADVLGPSAPRATA